MNYVNDLLRYLFAKPKNLAILLGWLAVSFVLIYSLYHVRSDERERAFIEGANNASDAVLEKIKINEAVLESYVSFMRLNDDDERIRAFIAELRKTFRHLYTISFQQYVSEKDRRAFEQAMSRRGLKNYSIRDFSYESDRQFIEVAPASAYFPIYFIEPMGTDADQVLGLDIFSVPFLREPLLQSIQSGKAVASKPFVLAEGGRGYVLFKVVEANPDYSVDGGPEVDTKVVSICLKTSVLLAHAVEQFPLASIRLIFNDSNSAGLQESYHAPLDRDIIIPLETNKHKRKLAEYGQPFTLEFTKTEGLCAQDLGLGMLFLSVSLVSFVMYLNSAYRREKSIEEKDGAFAQLAKERELLDLHVKKRTCELEEQRLANSLLSQRLINVQEDEFRNIARELHDEFGQNLTAINTNAKIVGNLLVNKDVRLASSQDIRAHTDKLYDSLHTMMRRLRPETLDTFGVEAAIQELISSFKLDLLGIECKLFVSGDIAQANEQQTIAIYRSIQELINNALKHSSAKVMIISLSVTQNNIVITCHNQLDKAVNKVIKGYGLLGLEERAKALGGSIDINTSDGWLVTISYPIDNKSLSHKEVS